MSSYKIKNKVIYGRPRGELLAATTIESLNDAKRKCTHRQQWITWSRGGVVVEAQEPAWRGGGRGSLLQWLAVGRVHTASVPQYHG